MWCYAGLQQPHRRPLWLDRCWGLVNAISVLWKKIYVEAFAEYVTWNSLLSESVELRVWERNNKRTVCLSGACIAFSSQDTCHWGAKQQWQLIGTWVFLCTTQGQGVFGYFKLFLCFCVPHIIFGENFIFLGKISQVTLTRGRKPRVQNV